MRDKTHRTDKKETFLSKQPTQQFFKENFSFHSQIYFFLISAKHE